MQINGQKRDASLDDVVQNASRGAKLAALLGSDSRSLKQQRSCKPVDLYQASALIKGDVQTQGPVKPFKSEETQGKQVAELAKEQEKKRASSHDTKGRPPKQMLRPDNALIQKLMAEEKDERYRYLLKQGTIHSVEADTHTIFVELKQIPSVLVIYRRPMERQLNADKVQLQSRGLTQIPLLEGEEQLKHLFLQGNLIKKIDHLVSLPNLQTLDLSSNKLIEINNFWVPGNSLDKLRTVNLAKNQIRQVRNLDRLQALEHLDLSDNKVSELSGLDRLQSLKTLNLQGNLIEYIDLPEMASLQDLNLRRNKISIVNKLAGFVNLSKLNLGLNLIKCISNLQNSMPQLRELSLDQNPIALTLTPQSLLKGFPSLVYYNQQKITESALSSYDKGSRKQKSQSEPPGDRSTPQVDQSSYKPKNECNVIKIIQKEWAKEVQRLNQKQSSKIPGLGEKSLVQSGHAEIEGNKVLYIYGNALEVLQRTEFYDLVEEIHLVYVRFDLIVYHLNLQKLKKFGKLKRVVLSNNYLSSFILLSKIECLSTVESLKIYDNEVLNCLTLTSFIVYRFQHIQSFNGVDLDQEERKKAKQQFQLFDKILSVQNLFTRKSPAQVQAQGDPVKRNEVRQDQKKNQDFSSGFIRELLSQVIIKEDKLQLAEQRYEKLIKDLVSQTVRELEDVEMLERLMKQAGRK